MTHKADYRHIHIIDKYYFWCLDLSLGFFYLTSFNFRRDIPKITIHKKVWMWILDKQLLASFVDVLQSVQPFKHNTVFIIAVLSSRVKEEK